MITDKSAAITAAFVTVGLLCSLVVIVAVADVLWTMGFRDDIVMLGLMGVVVIVWRVFYEAFK